MATSAPTSSESQSLKAGDMIAGRYRLVSELGRGNMGVVYRAVHEDMNREVALKTLLPHASKHPRLVGRFKREVQVISQLRHPNTVTIFDYGALDDSTLYFAMELLQGRSLGSTIRRNGPISPPRVKGICVQILKSLMEAHEKGIIHRDLKPDNIFLEEIGSESDYVKVLDFSIAKALAPLEGDSSELTAVGMTVGTPVYMAPEQFNQGEVTAATDLYALGHMMYEMLGGRPIFQGASWIEIAMHKTEDKPVKLRDDIICSELGGVIVRAIKAEASERYQSAEQMLADIEVVGALEDQPAFPHAREVTSMKADTHQLVVQTPFGPRAVTNASHIIPAKAPEPVEDSIELDDEELVELDPGLLEEADEFEANVQVASLDPLLIEPESDGGNMMEEDATSISIAPSFEPTLDPMASEVTRVQPGLDPPPAHHNLSHRLGIEAPPDQGMDEGTRQILVVAMIGMGFLLLFLALVLVLMLFFFGLGSPA